MNEQKHLRTGMYLYAENELRRAAMKAVDEYGMHDKDQEKIYSNALDLIGAFSDQGQTGESAAIIFNILNRIIRFKPISPLTGEDDEWIEIKHTSELKLYQNARCASVFKMIGSNLIFTYDLDATLVSLDGGKTFGFDKKYCKTPITFPYDPPIVPEHKIIEMEVKDNGSTD